MYFTHIEIHVFFSIYFQRAVLFLFSNYLVITVVHSRICCVECAHACSNDIFRLVLSEHCDGLWIWLLHIPLITCRNPYKTCSVVCYLNRFMKLIYFALRPSSAKGFLMEPRVTFEEPYFLIASAHYYLQQEVDLFEILMFFLITEVSIIMRKRL